MSSGVFWVVVLFCCRLFLSSFPSKTIICNYFCLPLSIRSHPKGAFNARRKFSDHRKNVLYELEWNGRMIVFLLRYESFVIVDYIAWLRLIVLFRKLRQDNFSDTKTLRLGIGSNLNMELKAFDDVKRSLKMKYLI